MCKVKFRYFPNKKFSFNETLLIESDEALFERKTNINELFESSIKNIKEKINIHDSELVGKLVEYLREFDTSKEKRIEGKDWISYEVADEKGTSFGGLILEDNSSFKKELLNILKCLISKFENVPSFAK